jgi:quercetin dioxygenase-like cupin family protein
MKMIIRLYTGEDGQSHFEDIALPRADDERGRGQTPLQGAATGLEFARLPSGYASAWHTASRHAYAIILSGQMECTIGDGTVRRLGPGDIMLAEDFTGKGHFNRGLDDQPLLVAFVRI